MFYVLAAQKNGGLGNFSVRKQLRPGGGFVLSEEGVCDGYQICAGSPNKKVEDGCQGGMQHSIWLFDTGRHNSTVASELAQAHRRCEEA